MLNFQVDVSVKHHLKQSIVVNAQFSATIKHGFYLTLRVYLCSLGWEFVLPIFGLCGRREKVNLYNLCLVRGKNKCVA